MRRVSPSILTKVERMVTMDTTKQRSDDLVSSHHHHHHPPHYHQPSNATSTLIAFPIANVESAFPSAGLSPERTPPSPCPSPVVMAAMGMRNSASSATTSPAHHPASSGRSSVSDAYKLCHNSFERLCAMNSRKFAPLSVVSSTHSSPDWLDRVDASPSVNGADAPLPGRGRAAPKPPALTTEYHVPTQWNGSEPATVFHSSILPSVSLVDLGIMIAAQVPHCPAEMTIAAIVLARRYCSMTGTQPTAHMMHRLYLACLQLAIKAHCDHFVSSHDFARISGLSSKEMYRLEKHVLQGISWRAQVVRAETQHELESCAELDAAFETEVSWDALLSKPNSTCLPRRLTPRDDFVHAAGL